VNLLVFLHSTYSVDKMHRKFYRQVVLTEYNDDGNSVTRIY